MLEYKLGNSAAFAVIYDRHVGRLYGYLLKKLRSEAVAKDVLQETLLKLHRFRDRYSREYPFTPWLFTICRNTLTDYFRSIDKQAVLDENIDTYAAKSETSLENLSPNLQKLTGREKEVIDLHYLQGFPFEEIASRLKLAPTNARQISSRAIKKLRNLWSDENE